MSWHATNTHFPPTSTRGDWNTLEPLLRCRRYNRATPLPLMAGSRCRAIVFERVSAKEENDRWERLSSLNRGRQSLRGCESGPCCRRSVQKPQVAKVPGQGVPG